MIRVNGNFQASSLNMEIADIQSVNGSTDFTKGWKSSRRWNNEWKTLFQIYIWDNVFRNRPSKVFRSQPYSLILKGMVCLNFFKACLPLILLSPFWMLRLICRSLFRMYKLLWIILHMYSKTQRLKILNVKGLNTLN